MNTWQKTILKPILRSSARLVCVADPDHLLSDTELLQAIKQDGWEILEYDDPILFRYHYESRYRQHWDNGQNTDQRVLIYLPHSDLYRLPYDVLQKSDRVTLSLADLFPQIPAYLLQVLSPEQQTRLFEIVKARKAGVMGDKKAQMFILKHLFRTDLEHINSDEALLVWLLQRHYEGQIFPEISDRFIIAELKSREKFQDWPLEEIVPNRNAFFSFLQDRWPGFLRGMLGDSGITIRETVITDYSRIPHPQYLPFDKPGVRAYLDNLFTEDYLQPVPVENGLKIRKEWFSCGIIIDEVADRVRLVKKFIDRLDKKIPGNEAAYQEWQHFAMDLARLKSRIFTLPLKAQEKCRKKYATFEQAMDKAFQHWMGNGYRGLFNLPATQPVMVHHIPRHLSGLLEAHAGLRIALVVIDGLSVDQWHFLKERALRPSEITLEESVVFSWVPTITEVARISLLSGKLPGAFAATELDTRYEAKYWRLFWENNGFQQNQVYYQKALRSKDQLTELKDALSDSRIKIAGLVVDKIDQIMHGMKLGMNGMYNQICLWLEDGFFNPLLTCLFDHNFVVFVTADHGNIESRGCGAIREGCMASIRGSRVRIYPDEALRHQGRNAIPGAVEWPASSLPENYYPLLAPQRRAFATEGEVIVTHGGIAPEEVLVPLVKLTQRK